MFNKFSVKIILLIVATIAFMAAGIAVVAWKRIAETSYEAQKHAALNVLRLVTRNIQNQYNQLVDFEMEFIVKRRELMRQENATILAHLDSLLRMTREGRLPGDQARAQALEWIAGRRNPDRDVIVFDADLVSLSQADTSMIGKSLGGFRNIRGGDAFQSMLDRLGNASENYSVIFWPTVPGGPPHKQLAYFSVFPAWGWIIARTEPIDELEDIVASKREAILRDISLTMMETNIPGSGYLFLFSGAGEMLVHPRLVRGQVDESRTQNLTSSLKTAARTPGVPYAYEWSPLGTTDPPRRKIAFVEYFKPLDWYISYSLVAEDLESAATELIRELLQIILVAAGLSIATLLYFLRRFTRPVAEVMELVKGLPGREFVLDQRDREALEILSRGRGDEVGRLANAFLGLQGRLESHLEELGRLGRERAMHIKALENAKLSLEARVSERTANLLRTNELLTLEMRQREETTASLRSSEEKFRALAESMPGIVYLVKNDERFTMLYLNDFVERLTGYAKEDFLEGWIRYLDLIHPDDREGILEQAARAVGARLPYRIEYRIRRKDGRWRWFEDHGTGVAAADGRVAYLEGVINDMTDRVTAREALLQAKDQAEQANRAKSDFLANMSHEIRTPLNVVLGMAEMLEGTGLSAEQRRYVANLASAGGQLLELISDILDFSRIESGGVEVNAEPFDLQALLSGVAAMVRPAAEKKGLGFAVHCEPKAEGWRLGDAPKIRQVLVNLAANAVKFTRQGEVRLDVSEQGPDWVVFSVRDTGEGIAKDKHQLVFEKFTQADPSIHSRYGGTGLGLAISRKLVLAMGGDIRLESEPGAGSTFFVSLPLPACGPSAADPADTLRIGQRPAPDAPLRTLVAEDVEANQEVIRIYLQDAPVSLAFVGSGTEAVARCRDESFDVVLMDVEMPGMDGIEATRAIRAMERETGRPAARIIALTAHALAEFRTRCLAAGCDGYLVKPLSRRDLYETLGLGEPACAKAGGAVAPPCGPSPGEKEFVERIPAKLKPLLPVFFASLDRQLHEARATLVARDWPGLARTGHTIKGTTATYGMSGLSAMGLDLESAAKKQDIPASQGALERLCQAREHLHVAYTPG
ncbi:MAG: ATP-binding protein [Desulfovibrionaceae bacterium]|nr:ATP-binding protein [Desulfovibrionaceae bacterium]